MGLLRTIYYNLKLNRNLKKKRSEIKRLQEKKLRKLLIHAFDNSSFYRDLYCSEGISREDLLEIPVTDLPTIDKEIMMENFNQIVVDDNISREKVENFLEKHPDPTTLLEEEYRVLHTSGSTGRLGYFLYNKSEWDFVKAISLRMFDKFRLKPKRYAFIGASDGHYAGISLFLSPLKQFEEIFYEDFLIININRPLGDYIDQLNDLQPHNLTGYPSAVRILAEKQREGKTNIAPDNIICGGETFTPQDKKYIAETWDVEPINYYASSESLMIGVGRPDSEGIFIFDDANIVEIKEDRTLITNLYNFTQPLIRYEMSDVLTPEDNNFSSQKPKWPFSRIKEIIGRREETLWFKNQSGQEEFIHPIVLVEFYVRGLKKYQVIQDSKRSFIFRAVIENRYDNNAVKKRIKQRLNQLLQEKRLSNLEYRIEISRDITPDSSTGKFKLIKKHLM